MRTDVRRTGCHPLCRRPALRGAGRRPVRHVKRTLTQVRTLAGRAVVCSARSDRRQAGWPCVTTHGPQRADGVAAISEPERPRRRRSKPQPCDRRQLADTPACAPLRRAGSWPRGPAGCRPTTSLINVLSCCGGPLGFPLPRQPPGVLRGRSRSAECSVTGHS